MNVNTLHNIVKFLKSKGKEPPFFYKLKYYPETLKGEELNVKGKVELEGKGLPRLPDNLTVIGDLVIFDNDSGELPKNLTVTEYLGLSRNRMTYLPSDLKVGEEISVTQLDSTLTISSGFKLPPMVEFSDLKDLKLRGDWSRVERIRIQRMKLERFPEVSKPLRKVWLYKAYIDSFPDGLVVEDFHIVTCLDKIKELPRNLTITGVLEVTPTYEGKRIPENAAYELRQALEERGGRINKIEYNLGAGIYIEA